MFSSKSGLSLRAPIIFLQNQEKVAFSCIKSRIYKYLLEKVKNTSNISKSLHKVIEHVFHNINKMIGMGLYIE